MKKSKENREIIMIGARVSFSNLVGVLERTASGLDGLLPSLKIQSLPEYQNAVDAVRKYGEAVIRRLDEEYAKRN